MKRRTGIAILAGLIAAPLVTLGLAFAAGRGDAPSVAPKPVAAVSAAPVTSQAIPSPTCDGNGDESFCYLDLPAGEWLFNRDNASGTIVPTWQPYPTDGPITIHLSEIASTD